MKNKIIIKSFLIFSVLLFSNYSFSLEDKNKDGYQAQEYNVRTISHNYIKKINEDLYMELSNKQISELTDYMTDFIFDIQNIKDKDIINERRTKFLEKVKENLTKKQMQAIKENIK